MDQVCNLTLVLFCSLALVYLHLCIYSQEIMYCRNVCYPDVSREDCLEAYGIAGGVPRLTLLHLARKVRWRV